MYKYKFSTFMKTLAFLAPMTTIAIVYLYIYNLLK